MKQPVEKRLRFVKNIPASSLLEKIKVGEEIEYEHTNLQNAKRSKIDIAEIMSCNADYSKISDPKYPTVQSLVTYPITRSVFFETIATIETELQIGEEADLFHYVDVIHNKVSETDFKGYETEITTKAEQKTDQILNAIKSNERHNPAFDRYLAVYNRIKSNFDNQNYQVSDRFLQEHNISTREEAFELLVKMTIEDMIYNEEMKNCIKNTVIPIVQNVIDDFIQNNEQFPVHDIKGNVVGHEPLKRLSMHQGNERMTFMLAGAPASGKGTILVKIFDDAKTKYGIDEKDMVKVNTDSHRLLVCKGYEEKLGEKKTLHVSLNNDESAYITALCYERMNQKINANNAPHMLIDGVAPDESRVKLGTENDGKLEISIITVDRNKSIKRAQERGDKTGRYVQTSYLLNAHRSVSEKTYNLVGNTDLIGKKDITVSIYDNNVPYGQSPINLAYIDIKNGNAIIYDPDRLAEFRGKIKAEPITTKEQFFSVPIKHKTKLSDSQELLSEKGYNVQMPLHRAAEVPGK